MKETRTRSRRLLAFLLIFAVLFTQFMPLTRHTAYAAQQNSYHDPAEHWLSAVNRTNELDANAVLTHETFYCAVCEKSTSFSVWRTPEYTRNGMSALSRNVLYSDGTMVGGEGMGSILDGTPGVDAYYTGYHWTKCMCDTCGTMNCDSSVGGYSFNKNVYILYDCATEFMQKLDETATFEYADRQYHKETRTGGSHCAFCYGTFHNETSRLTPHNMETEVLSQPANQRFTLVSHCKDCEYVKYDYIAAKVVVADYYGVVDGQPHTITVSDLSEAGVRASIRYGTSANNCNLTSAPNFTEEGQYVVYYEVTYKLDSSEMVESGVAYVWLHDEISANGGCSCGCGDPNCDCRKTNCNGGCCNTSCGNNHKFSLIESVKPTCLALGYDRYLCVACGKIEKRDYVDSLGHAMQQILIREATCEADGKVLNICSRCGLAEVEYTPKGEHKYGTFSVAPTCTSPGYTVKECSICGDRHITAMTNALPHDYAAHPVLPTCTTGGQTTYLCEGCGGTFIGDHTEPLGHVWNDGVYIVEPTCAEDGVIEYTCTRCGAKKQETVAGGLHSSCADTLTSAHKMVFNSAANTLQTQSPVLNAASSTFAAAANTSLSSAGTKAGGGHVAGAAATCTTPQTCVVCGAVLVEATGHRYWRETTPPACKDMGYVTYTCINCDHSYKSDYVSALGHDYTEQVTSPTCTQQGYTTYTCRTCGDSYTGNYREIIDHNWDNGREMVNATCNGAGITEYHCQKCDAVQLETESAAGHTAAEAAATCTAPQLCAKCGAVLKQALGHKLNREITPATCLEMGYTTYACQRCDLNYNTDYTKPLGHSYDKEIMAPTCLEQGYTIYTCIRCNDSYISDYTDAVGHKWNDGKNVISATCGGEGLTEYRCANAKCNEVRLESKAALGHTSGAAATCTEPQLCSDCGVVLTPALGHSFTKRVIEPTCTDTGYTEYSCTSCGLSYKEDYLQAAGHIAGEWIVDKQPTLTDTGSKSKVCTKCSQVTETEDIERLSNQGITDGKGEAAVGKYLVTVGDTNTQKPVSGAKVSLYVNNAISVDLPSGRPLDSEAQTTVQVQSIEEKAPLKAVPNLTVSVTDCYNNYSAGKTDRNGQIIVPGYEPISEKHGAYIVGYTDGTFRPEAQMTRAEAAAIFARLLAAAKDENISPAKYTIFADTAVKAWYADYLNYLVGWGVIAGEQTNFRPNEDISRAELTAMAVRYFDACNDGKTKIVSTADNIQFNDISSSYWAAEYIQEAALYGWVQGYGNGSFRGDAKITRAEAVTLINNLLGRSADGEYIAQNGRKLNTFSDVYTKHWAYAAILEAANGHTAILHKNGESWNR